MSSSLSAKSGALLSLYFAQGLPFGFQATALPLLLRQQGVSLKAIGFASLLSAPWLLKPLWAPFVDRYWSVAFGRRKSWIVPMQAGLCATSLAAAAADEPHVLAALVLVMNLFAATQDIAVDGLAVSWLTDDELGPANAIQVVGYKLGMLTGGGLLVWASGHIGRAGMFEAMAGLMLAVLFVSLGIREGREESSLPAAAPLQAREIVSRLSALFVHQRTFALLFVVATYKMGEAMADAMWKPMLFDQRFTAAQIGLWTGTIGMVFSLAGSAVAGVIARRVPLVQLLLWVSALRTLGVAGEWWIAVSGHTARPPVAAVLAVTSVEHAVGGALTTVLFALMMRHTDREIGGTHYTLLASVEVWGKLPLAAFSGYVATGLGYGGLFGVATGICALFVVVVASLQSRLGGPDDTARARVS